MGELITQYKFGGRSSQLPPDEPSDYGERRGRLDAQYMTTFPEECNKGLDHVSQAIQALEVTVRSVRQLPPDRRRRSPMEVDLQDLFAELSTAMGTLQTNATYYAKLIIEIEERVFNARRYLGEHRGSDEVAKFFLPEQFRT